MNFQRSLQTDIYPANLMCQGHTKTGINKVQYQYEETSVRTCAETRNSPRYETTTSIETKRSHFLDSWKYQ